MLDKILKHKVVAIVGVLASAIAIWQFVVDPLVLGSIRRDRFDEKVSAIWEKSGSELRSSTHFMLSVLHQNVFSTRDHAHWTSFTRNWVKHARRFERLYEPISDGLVDGDLEAGEEGKRLCQNVTAVLKSHHSMRLKISSISGITVSTTGEDAPELGVFGPVVRIPAVPSRQLFPPVTLR